MMVANAVSGASVQIPNQLRPIPNGRFTFDARTLLATTVDAIDQEVLVRSAATGSHQAVTPPWTALWATCSVWT
ncbi:MAG: hypothetical protein R2854_05485 [Caldilineaceae bacterium]